MSDEEEIPYVDEGGLLKNTIHEEKVNVCAIVRRLGLRLSGLMFAAGVLVLGFGISLFVTPFDPILSTRLSILFIGALAFIGSLNILCGLLLLLGEKD